MRERTSDQVDAPQVSVLLDASTVENASMLERLLDETAERLAKMPETPLRRELFLVVERYRRALGEWKKQAPTQLQRVILIDCIKALHYRVASRAWRKPPPPM